MIRNPPLEALLGVWTWLDATSTGSGCAAVECELGRGEREHLIVLVEPRLGENHLDCKTSAGDGRRAGKWRLWRQLDTGNFAKLIRSGVPFTP